jgi:hypothetical protein
VSEAAAIEFFNELNMRWSHFSELSDDQKAALAIVCFAASEVNALAKMYIFAQHELTGKDAIDYGIMAQTHSILRTWSAKLFEMSEFVEFKGKYNKTKDTKLQKLGDEAFQSFKPLMGLEGHRIAKSLRHEATSHYYLAPVKSNLPFVDDKANCSFYLHSSSGNSNFPLGDEVVFAGLLNREGAKFQSLEDKLEVYRLWWRWNLDATKWLHAVHLAFFRELVAPLAREKGIKMRRRAYWIDPALVSQLDQPKLPVVLRK